MSLGRVVLSSQPGLSPSSIGRQPRPHNQRKAAPANARGVAQGARVAAAPPASPVLAGTAVPTVVTSGYEAGQRAAANARGMVALGTAAARPVAPSVCLDEAASLLLLFSNRVV